MKWKYYMPAEWNPNERHTWEDIWLLPDDENYDGGSVWLTVDSLTSDAEFRAQEDLPPRQIPVGLLLTRPIWWLVWTTLAKRKCCVG
jgi:hypothetical protein